MSRGAESRSWRALTGEYARTIGIVAGTTLALLVFRGRLLVTDVAMLFLVPVVLVAARYHRGAALLASALAVALFDLLFIPPYYTFRVAEPDYLFTFLVMFVVALAMSGLTAAIREQKEEAGRRERRTAALYAMSRDLVRAGNRAELLAAGERHLGLAAGGRATLLLSEDADFESENPRWPPGGVFDSLFVRLAAGWTSRFGQPSGPGTPHEFDAEAAVVPLPGPSGEILGVVALEPHPEGRVLLPEALATALLLARRLGEEVEGFRAPGWRAGARR